MNHNRNFILFKPLEASRSHDSTRFDILIAALFRAAS
jgi:hypothetical protein